jgi:hypothetical protein
VTASPSIPSPSYKPEENCLFDFALVELRNKPALVGSVSEALIASAGFLKVNCFSDHGAFYRIYFVAIQDVAFITPLSRQLAMVWAKRLKTSIPIEKIFEEVLFYFNLERSVLLSRTRSKFADHARKVFCFIAWELTGRTQAEIGAFCGDRGHETVSYNVTRLKAELPLYADVREAVQTIWFKVAGEEFSLTKP